MASGETWATASAAVGVGAGLLHRWQRLEAQRAFKPVVLQEPVAPQPVSALGSVAVTTPDGFRIEGLDVDGACVLLEVIRCSG